MRHNTRMSREIYDNEVLPMRDKVYRFARSILGDAFQAEDAVQSVMERLWRRRDRLGHYENVGAVVMVTARNVSIDMIRRRRETETIERLKTVEGHTHEINDTHQIVEDLIKKLPETMRTVIHLRDIEGYEIDEIAEIVKRDAPTVRVYLSRARKTVREDLIKIMNYGN